MTELREPFEYTEFKILSVTEQSDSFEYSKF